jgi:hypothetical protein
MHLTASPEDYLSAGEQDYLSTLPPAIKDVLMVVLVNDGSRSDTDLKVREADLSKHLINDRNQDQAPAAAVPTGNTLISPRWRVRRAWMKRTSNPSAAKSSPRAIMS